MEPAGGERFNLATAADSFPVYVAAKPAGAEGEEGVQAANSRRTLRIGRWVVLAGAAALILCLVASSAVWRTAQEGLARMQSDVANAIKLETVRAHSKQATPPLQQDVQSVAFQGDKAMAAIVVTRTLATDQVFARTETHFYALTAKGWQRTRPQAEFWGQTETLDTASLHFVYGSADRAMVEQMAPSAEALYMGSVSPRCLASALQTWRLPGMHMMQTLCPVRDIASRKCPRFPMLSCNERTCAVGRRKTWCEGSGEVKLPAAIECVGKSIVA